jgi:hypothetical protein
LKIFFFFETAYILLKGKPRNTSTRSAIIHLQRQKKQKTKTKITSQKKPQLPGRGENQNSN